MLPDLKPGVKLHITPAAESRSRHNFISHVANILGNQQLLVYTPISKGNLVRLPEGEEYLFDIYTQNELFQASGTVLEHCIIESHHYMIIKYNDWQRIQRRTFFRLQCLLDFTYSNLSEITEEKPIHKLPVYKGMIKNLSGGGMYFVTNTKLAQNDIILCHLSLNDKMIVIKGKIRGVELPRTRDDHYKYRAEFVEMERMQEEQIVRFVFSLQLKMIKKMGEDEM